MKTKNNLLITIVAFIAALFLSRAKNRQKVMTRKSRKKNSLLPRRVPKQWLTQPSRG
jgi:hypothetical protein